MNEIKINEDYLVQTPTTSVSNITDEITTEMISKVCSIDDPDCLTCSA